MPGATQEWSTFKVLNSGRALALPAIIRLGWKDLPGTNTPAYYKKFVNYGQKNQGYAHRENIDEIKYHHDCTT
jgi:hypothetical protein